MLKEFREFAIRGNVVDLAVAVIIGGAFGKIITSLVNDIIMPIIGIFMGGVDFTSLAITVGGAQINYGLFIQNVVDFIIIAFVIFLMISAINRMRAKEPTPAAPAKKDCPRCFTNIPIPATRCPNCTSEL